MEWLSIILILFFALVLLAFLLKYTGLSVKKYSYQKREVLFTPAERSFFGVLNQAVAGTALVFGKVWVADVLMPIKGMSRSNWQKAFNKISSKHFDFLLCDTNDLSVLCAIELNDRSHESDKRSKRDEFLGSACRTAGLPLIQIPARANYSIPDLQALLLKLLDNQSRDMRVSD